jgi:hypothetical protein
MVSKFQMTIELCKAAVAEALDTKGLPKEGLASKALKAAPSVASLAVGLFGLGGAAHASDNPSHAADASFAGDQNAVVLDYVPPEAGSDMTAQDAIKITFGNDAKIIQNPNNAFEFGFQDGDVKGMVSGTDFDGDGKFDANEATKTTIMEKGHVAHIEAKSVNGISGFGATVDGGSSTFSGSYEAAVTKASNGLLAAETGATPSEPGGTAQNSGSTSPTTTSKFTGTAVPVSAEAADHSSTRAPVATTPTAPVVKATSLKM